MPLVAGEEGAAGYPQVLCGITTESLGYWSSWLRS